jgi:hypothetical protein
MSGTHFPTGTIPANSNVIGKQFLKKVAGQPVSGEDGKVMIRIKTG